MHACFPYSADWLAASTAMYMFVCMLCIDAFMRVMHVMHWCMYVCVMHVMHWCIYVMHVIHWCIYACDACDEPMIAEETNFLWWLIYVCGCITLNAERESERESERERDGEKERDKGEKRWRERERKKRKRERAVRPLVHAVSQHWFLSGTYMYVDILFGTSNLHGTRDGAEVMTSSKWRHGEPSICVCDCYILPDCFQVIPRLGDRPRSFHGHVDTFPAGQNNEGNAHIARKVGNWNMIPTFQFVHLSPSCYVNFDCFCLGHAELRT